MNNPRVSIVIPCYNAERYVGQAIESALGQTYGRAEGQGPRAKGQGGVEVIVIDDGSTDGSVEAIRSFGDAIRWESGPNRGACAARNRGIELARGELVQFLDADDLLHPRKLEVQVAELQRSGADLVFCDGQVEVDGQRTAPYARRFDGGDPVVFVLGGPMPTPSAIHYRRNLQRIGGFRQDLPCSQERDLHLRLACEGLRFGHLAQSLYTVRRVAGSISSDSVRVLDQRAGILWPAYQVLQSKGELTDARQRAFAGRMASDARAYLRHGRPEKAAEYFQHARRMHAGGGLEGAYSGGTRLLRSVVGAALTERLVGLKRRLA